MGAAFSTPLWDPFTHDDRNDPLARLGRLRKPKNGLVSPSTSNSSLASSQREPSPTPGSHPPPSTPLTSSVLMGSNAPPLYEHALVGDWVSLMKRIALHPKEARYQDKCKNTPLHVSCRRQPPTDVVAALIRAHPAAVVATTLDGLTPIHFACYCGSDSSTVQTILGHLEKQKSLKEMVDRRGRTPLHCVCAGFRSPHRLHVISLLLERDPSCAIAPDERGRTPLSLIVDDYAEELQEFLEKSTEEAIRHVKTPGGDLYECWEVINLILKAAYHGTIQDPQAGKGEVSVHGKFQVLHAAVGVGACPSVFIRLILKVDPESIEQTDSDSNLPLHIYCKTQPKQLSHTSTMAQHLLWRTSSSMNRSWNALSDATSSLDSKPKAATTDATEMEKKKALNMTATGVVYNADFGRSSSFTNLKTTPLPSVNENTAGSAQYFPRRQPQEDVTVDLLLPFPKAARMTDEFGKLPFLLGLESGKKWKTCLEPLYQAYPDELRSVGEINSQLEKAIDDALESSNPVLRKETTKTLKHLCKLWPRTAVNDWILHLIAKVRHARKEIPSGASTGDIAWRNGIQASLLRGLASVLANVLPTDTNLPDSPLAALEVATAMLSHKDEDVRVGAAQVIGISAALLGKSRTDKVINDVVFQTSDDHEEDSSFFSAAASMITAGTEDEQEEKEAPPPSSEALHGRAMACYFLLKEEPQKLSVVHSSTIKDWMKHEDVIVRKAACLVIGATLAASNNEMSLKEFRSSILKSMRATEDYRVHISLARGLSMVAKKQPNFFVCKSGLPILDGALLLSMTTKMPDVQRAFHLFLWWALLPEEEAGLKEYMKLAQGENGRIMMTLVAKTLQKMVHVDDEEE